MKRFILSLAATAALMAASPANAAFLFENEGDSHFLTFNGMENGDLINGLSGTLLLTLADITGTAYTFNYEVENTSAAPVTQSRISAFGFNVDPNFVSAAILTGGVFDNKSSGNVPNGLPNVEFCATAGPNCSGGGGDGVFIGDSSIGSFKLTLAAPSPAIGFDQLYLRYQSIDAPTLGIRGGSATGIPTLGGGPNGAIPEPTTWALMILGFGGAGAMLRRRHEKSSVMLA